MWFLALWPVCIAIVIIFLPERFTASAWKFAFAMPGGYATWGGALLVIGSVMAVAVAWHTRRGYYLYIAGLILVGLWWFVLGAMFLGVSLMDRLANPIGGLGWTPIAFFHWYWAWRLYRHHR